MRRAWLALALAGCSGSPALSGPLGMREVGTIPNPPGAGGRDAGLSVEFAGRSVWIFGDTFFADGLACVDLVDIRRDGF